MTTAGYLLIGGGVAALVLLRWLLASGADERRHTHTGHVRRSGADDRSGEAVRVEVPAEAEYEPPRMDAQPRQALPQPGEEDPFAARWDDAPPLRSVAEIADDVAPPSWTRADGWTVEAATTEIERVCDAPSQRPVSPIPVDMPGGFLPAVTPAELWSPASDGIVPVIAPAEYGSPAAPAVYGSLGAAPVYGSPVAAPVYGSPVAVPEPDLVDIGAGIVPVRVPMWVGANSPAAGEADWPEPRESVPPTGPDWPIPFDQRAAFEEGAAFDEMFAADAAAMSDTGVSDSGVSDSGVSDTGVLVPAVSGVEVDRAFVVRRRRLSAQRRQRAVTDAPARDSVTHPQPESRLPRTASTEIIPIVADLTAMLPAVRGPVAYAAAGSSPAEAATATDDRPWARPGSSPQPRDQRSTVYVSRHAGDPC